MGVRLMPCSAASATSESGTRRVAAIDDTRLDAAVRALDLADAVRRWRCASRRVTIASKGHSIRAVSRRRKRGCVILARPTQQAARPPRARGGPDFQQQFRGGNTYGHACGYCLCLCLPSACWRRPAEAQYAPIGTSGRATGETYHVEIGGDLWNPTPDIVISSEALGIAGPRIDFVKRLGIEKTRFKQLKIVLRPATKHKFRFEYTPITTMQQRRR